MEAEMEKEMKCDKVKWSKNIKGKLEQSSDDSDKKMQLNELSRQSSKSTS